MNPRELLRAATATLAAGILVFVSLPVNAEWPEKPVKLLVPYGPGGATSAMAQLLTGPFEKEFGQSVVIVNQGGGGGRVGTAAAARAKPDGYLWLMVPMGALTIGWQMANTGYAPEDFDLVGIVVTTPMGIAVRKDSPYTTLAELIGAGKPLKYATYGVGSALHLEMELFASENNWDITTISSQGGKTAIRKLLAGELDFAAVAATNLPAFYAKGMESEIRILAMLEPEERWRFLPDIPTAREEGFDLTSGVWLGIAAPKGVPAPILAKMRQVAEKVVTAPEAGSLFDKFYQSPGWLGHEEFAKTVEAEVVKYRKGLKQLGLYAE